MQEQGLQAESLSIDELNELEPEKPEEPAVTAPIHREGPKVRPNDPCPCGSGKKYKVCHG